MEKRKEAVTTALIERFNVIADAHLKISTQSVPKIFRTGKFVYRQDGTDAPSSLAEFFENIYCSDNQKSDKTTGPVSKSDEATSADKVKHFLTLLSSMMFYKFY